jgi:hypothetical protein
MSAARDISTGSGGGNLKTGGWPGPGILNLNRSDTLSSYLSGRGAAAAATRCPDVLTHIYAELNASRSAPFH